MIIGLASMGTICGFRVDIHSRNSNYFELQNHPDLIDKGMNMKHICTTCDGLGAIKYRANHNDPAHNVAQYNTIITSSGARLPFYGSSMLELGESIEFYEKPCKCNDGFVEWTHGISLPPLTKT